MCAKREVISSCFTSGWKRRKERSEDLCSICPANRSSGSPNQCELNGSGSLQYRWKKEFDSYRWTLNRVIDTCLCTQRCGSGLSFVLETSNICALHYRSVGTDRHYGYDH